MHFRLLTPEFSESPGDLATIHIDDTIIAVSTASGIARRAIVRLSGPDAFPLVQAAAPGTPGLASQPPYTLLPASIVLAGHTRVPAELYLMRAPSSYTREDVVEIHTFGSPVLLEMIVEDFLSRGARLAEAGEFTRRAYLNGRIDLAQAEAVLQVIRSRSDSELRLALRQLGGRFSGEIARVRDRLLEICALVELSIDFTDQDVEVVSPADLARSISDAAAAIAGLAAHGERQTGGSPGVSVAICGRPNVGKSSLLNAILGRDRSIVTHLPGTTRDVVEDLVELGGVLFRLSDTAGRRDTEDLIEREAVERAARTAKSADMVLLVLDAAEGTSPHELDFWNQLEGTARIAVVNKTDLPAAAAAVELAASLGNPIVVKTSCVSGVGIEDLKNAMVEIVRAGKIDASAPSFLLNARHCDAIRRAGEALARALHAAEGCVSAEFIAIDLRTALDALGEIAGHACTDDILNLIFSDFCIGK